MNTDPEEGHLENGENENEDATFYGDDNITLAIKSSQPDEAKTQPRPSEDKQQG